MNIDELLAKFGLSAEDISDIDTTNMDDQEIEARFAEIAEKKNQNFEDDHEATDNIDPITEQETEQPATEPTQDFALMLNQICDSIIESLHSVRYQDEYWGDMPRYWYIDCDVEAHEIYCYDEVEGYLCGMTYTMDGDKVVIDFASCKRKKVAYVDFEEGTAQNFSIVNEVFNYAKDKYSHVVSERDDLLNYKNEVIRAEYCANVKNKLGEFADLDGNEMFEALRNNHEGMSIEQIEAKCFEIRGRAQAAKFSMKETVPVRVPVNHGRDYSNEPYGGIFAEYGIGER